MRDSFESAREPHRILELVAPMRHIGAMDLILKSERLLLRPLVETDLDVEIEIGTDPEVMKYIVEPKTEDQIAQEMPNYVRRCAGGCIGIWCVTDRSTEEKFGTAILLPLPIDEDYRNWDLVAGDELPDCEIEIGYILKKSAWGNGYATETCRRLLKFAFQETPLNEIVAVTAPMNIASQNVLRKSGLAEEGMRRAYAKQHPGYRITRQQWSEKNQKAS